MKITFDALKVVQPIGEFYCGVMNAADLTSIAEADVRRLEDNDLDSYLGIQRPLKPSRVREINKYITHIDATFPNSVIVAIQPDFIEWDEEAKQLIITSNDDNAGTIAKILDGQHRLAGFDAKNIEFDLADDKTSFQILVTIFVDADISTQATIFATVNLAQTKVNKSLVYDLESLAESRSPERTCHDVAVVLNSDKSGPFYRSIKRLGVATKGVQGEFLTQATLVQNLVKFISPDPAADKNILLARKRGIFLRKHQELSHQDDASLRRYFFRKAFIEERDDIIAANISNFFSAVSDKWPEAWDKSIDASSLNKSIGFSALMRVFKNFYTSRTDTVSDWATVITRAEYSDFLGKSDLTSQFFIDLDPTTKSAGKIYKAFMSSISS